MYQPAARVGSTIGHPPGAPTGTVLAPGVPTVLIGGLPAAVVGTLCACSFPPPVPTNAVLPPVPPRTSMVLIGGMVAARVFDKCTCTGVILTGCPTVLIGG
jgi:uncharacterized Zn-binding protein involved in type VI secretion